MIRAATSADANILAGLRYEFRAAFGAVEESRPDFLRRCIPWIRQRLEVSSNWRAWLAESDGNAVGTIWLQLVEKIPNPVAELEWHGYITSLFVRESFRGRELGSGLLKAALDACYEKGVDAVILWPTPQSRSLYLRHGFVVDHQIMQRR